MGECLIIRRGGGGSSSYSLPVLNANYPEDQSIIFMSGDTATVTFEVKIDISGKPAEHTYQWYLNGTAISGANSSTYTWSGTTSGTHTIYCAVSNAAGMIISRKAKLNAVMYCTPTLNGSYPSDVSTMRNNTTTTLKVEIATAGNPSAYTYQWYWASGEAISGQTHPTMGFSLANAVGSYQFYCEVTNAAGTVRSRTATVTLTDTYLYYYGNEYSSVTGGWQLTRALEAEATASSVGTLTKESNALYASFDAPSWYGKNGFISTVNKINLTYYSKIRIYAYLYTEDSGCPWRNCATTSNTYANNYLSAYADAPYNSANGYANYYTWDVDVSGLSGSYYVGLINWIWELWSYCRIYSVQLIP